MTARLLSLGTATPTSAAQTRTAMLATSVCGLVDGPARMVEALYRRTGVRSRSSVLFPSDGAAEGQSFFTRAQSAEDRGPGTASRSDRYEQEAPRLAEAAARVALSGCPVKPQQFTHLVTASCTGFAAPGVDRELILRLGLPNTIQRTNVGFMGCHGAINAMRVAGAFAAADPQARVLVCAVELCSLHFNYSVDADRMVANALFADGAAAAVVSGGQPGVRAPAVRACGSCLFPDSADAMTWRIGDHGFEMTLSPRVPSLLQEHLPGWAASWLSGSGLAVKDVRSWAVHPGGPRVLAAVGEALGLPRESLAASRGVLEEHGNMSSPTVLFILERLRRERGSWEELLPCVAMAFGPGLVAEAVLLA